MGEVSNVVGVKSFDRARSYLAKMKSITLVDTQRSFVNSLLGLCPCKLPVWCSSFYCPRKSLGFRLDFILSPFSSFSICSSGITFHNPLSYLSSGMSKMSFGCLMKRAAFCRA
jgi:hypothetical protein